MNAFDGKSALNGLSAIAPVLLLLLFLGACAKTGEPGRVPADPVQALRTWNRFMTLSARAEDLAAPFRLNATLYYSGKEDSQRVTVYFWGNAEADTPLPLRLDILMGPGSVMAAARQDENGLFVHVPREATVYHAEEGNLAEALNLPIPFTLADLAYLVTGRYARLFASGGTTAAATVPESFAGEGKTFLYDIATSPLQGTLTLDDHGLPLAWSDAKDDGWTLTVAYWPDSTRTTPRKLHVKNAEGREATLIVRELSFPQTPFTPGQLELKVPPGTLLAPFDVAR